MVCSAFPSDSISLCDSTSVLRALSFCKDLRGAKQSSVGSEGD
jgi:hypothetical protein